MSDPNPNRCAYRRGPDRCAFLARIFPNCTEQAKDAALENGHCWEHFQCYDVDRGREVLERSLREIPIDADYSSPALIRAARLGYGSGELALNSDVEWAANVEACAPYLEELHALFVKAAKKPRPDAIPHLFGVDAEAAAERRALQSGL